MKATIRNSTEKISYFHVEGNGTGFMVYPLYLVETCGLDSYIVSRKYALYQTDINYIRMVDMMSDSNDSFDTAVPINPDGTYPYGGEAITVYEHSFLPTGIVPYSEIKKCYEMKLNEAIKECISQA